MASSRLPTPSTSTASSPTVPQRVYYTHNHPILSSVDSTPSFSHNLSGLWFLAWNFPPGVCLVALQFSVLSVLSGKGERGGLWAFRFEEQTLAQNKVTSFVFAFDDDTNHSRPGRWALLCVFGRAVPAKGNLLSSVHSLHSCCNIRWHCPCLWTDGLLVGFCCHVACLVSCPCALACHWLVWPCYTLPGGQDISASACPNLVAAPGQQPSPSACKSTTQHMWDGFANAAGKMCRCSGGYMWSRAIGNRRSWTAKSIRLVK
jgi:hypothetical protein